MSRGKRLLLFEAVRALALFRLLLLLLKFERIARLLGKPMRQSSLETDSETQFLAGEVAWAIRVAAGRVPWRCSCLNQAVAAMYLLRKRTIASTLYLGVARPGEHGLEAHAWLRCGPTILVGGGDTDRFTVLYEAAARLAGSKGGPSSVASRKPAAAGGGKDDPE